MTGADGQQTGPRVGERRSRSAPQRAQWPTTGRMRVVYGRCSGPAPGSRASILHAAAGNGYDDIEDARQRSRAAAIWEMSAQNWKSRMKPVIVGLVALACSFAPGAARSQDPVAERVAELRERLKDEDPAARQYAVHALGVIWQEVENILAILTEALKDKDAAVRRAAAQALVRLGPEAKEAVPALTGALSDEDTFVRRHAAAALRRVGPGAKGAVPALVHTLQDQDEWVRCEAAVALGAIGPEAREATAALIKMFRSVPPPEIHPGPRLGPPDKPRGCPAYALADIGAEAVPALATAMHDEDPRVRQNAAYALGGGGAKAVPFLIEALKDEDLGVRRRAIVSLLIQPHAQAAVPALAELIRDREQRLPGLDEGPPNLTAESYGVVAEAIDALGRIGGPSAVAALRQATEDRDLAVRERALIVLGETGSRGSQTDAVVAVLIRALDDEGARPVAIDQLGSCGPAASEAVPALLSLMIRDQSDDDLRWYVADALADIGPPAVPVLLDALATADARGRLYAVRALGGMGVNASAGVPALATVMKYDQDATVREQAVVALSSIGQSAVPALTEAISNESVRCFALDALGEMDFGETPADPQLIGALIRALKEEEDCVRWLAARALGKLGGDSESVLCALVGALGDGDSDVCRFAAESLGSFGARAKTAVPALIKQLLHEENVHARACAANALGRIAPESKEVVQALAAALQDDHWAPRRAAARTLASIGPGAQEAVPALIRALTHVNREMRCAAALALGRIGPGAQAAVPALVAALKDQDHWVVVRAAEALGNIGPGAAEAVPALSVALKDDRHRVIAKAVGNIGPAAREAVPALAGLLVHGRCHLREDAAEALGKIGPEAREAVPALKEALTDPARGVRKAAAVALRKIQLERRDQP